MSALICPRCQQANLCLAGTPQVAQCWCMQVKFPAELLAQTTTESQCICQQCLQQQPKEALSQSSAEHSSTDNSPASQCTAK